MSHHIADVIVRVTRRFEAAEADIAKQEWLEIIERFCHARNSIRLGSGDDVKLLTKRFLVLSPLQVAADMVIVLVS